MNHAFGAAGEFTVGLEEELLLVDRETLQLDHGAERVLKEIRPGRAARRSRGLPGVDRGALGAAPQRRRGGRRHRRGPRRRRSARAARRWPSACTPTRGFGDVRLVDSDRYRRVEGEMRGLIKRTPECALHVHVAMPSAGRRGGRADGAARGAAADRRDRRGLAVLVRLRLGPGERALGCDPGLSRARRPAAAARLGGVPRDARRDPARRRARGPHDGVVGRAPAAAAGHRRAARARRPDRARADGGDGGPGARRGAPGGRAAAGASWRRPRRCTGRASAPCATGSTRSCCSGAGCARRARRRASCWTSCAAATTRSRAWSGSSARAGRRRASARSSPRPAWRGCCGRWPTKPQRGPRCPDITRKTGPDTNALELA